MKSLLFAVALFAAGCDGVFGLQKLRQPDVDIDAAVQPDGLVTADAAIDAPPCTETVAGTVLVAEDTFLIKREDCPQAAANRFGAAPNVNIGQGSTSRGLFRFQLSPDMLNALSDGTASSLKLGFTMRPNDCAGGCTNSPTTFLVYIARRHWNEGGALYTGADWCHYEGTGQNGLQLPWEVPGANGNSDRTQTALVQRVVGSVETAVQGPFDVTAKLNPTVVSELLANTQVSTGSLSLVVVPSSATGTLYLYSREGKTDATTLTLRQCQ